MLDDSAPARQRYSLRRSLDGVLARPRVLWALAVLAMVLDVAITGVGLSLGLSERNPVAQAAIDAVGLFGAGVVLKGGVLLFGYVCWRLFPRLLPTTPDHHRNVVPLGMALPSWVAVGVNTALVLSVL
jgi:hypothetical protein